MTWIKLDDNAVDHPKVASLTDKAFRVWVTSLCYASEFLTDGVLPAYFLKPIRTQYKKELFDTGLWDRDAHGNVSIHDYLIHQSSRDYVEAEREIKRRRSAFHRNENLKKQIRHRDGDQCRYCGKDVNWADRRGPVGGTYDHVIPRGEETFDNMVVACRYCNNSKGPRTPEQAGMKLLPIKFGLNTDSIRIKNELVEEIREQKIEIREHIQRTEHKEQKKELPPPVVMSPKEYARRSEHCAFVGSRIEVPNILHAELRKGHGGDDPERELQRWYLDLNEAAELGSWRIPNPIFKWLKEQYAVKFPPTPVNGTKSINDQIDDWARS